jgi:rod shape-determining protein MreB
MSFWKSQEIGIDLGTASILVYVEGKGIVLDEPSVVAIDTNTNEVLAVGEAAQAMIGRTPSNIAAIRPLRNGVISDYKTTEIMIRYILNKVCTRSLFKPKVVVCIPSIVTDVEKKSVVDATTNAGARSAYLIEEPIAAAIGADIDISKAEGTMVIDVGGGTCDIAVISLGGTVVHDSIKIAGDEFDQAIIKYIRKTHNILIGERTAEIVKRQIGCVYPMFEPTSMDIKGRSLITGLPAKVNVTSNEILDALTEPAMAIVSGVKSVLEQTPPEILGDIIANGLLFTGGGSLVKGLDELVSKNLGIKTRIAENPTQCVAIGTGKSLSHIELLKDHHI